MQQLFAQLEESVAAVRTRWSDRPVVGLVLGSGMGRLAEFLDVEADFTAEQIPHYPESTALGHRGRFLCGRLASAPVVLMDGRQHGYEGHDLAKVVYPVRLMSRLGITTLILSNASGGVNPQLSGGDVVVVDDHINLLWDNPLIGPNDEQLGPRFPDMCTPYDTELADIAESAIVKRGGSTHRGVYLAQQGPCYETRAEYRMARQLGADVVGMSTVPEVIVGVHEGLRVVALSVVSNVFSENSDETTTGEAVIATVDESVPLVHAAVTAVIEHIVTTESVAQ